MSKTGLKNKIQESAKILKVSDAVATRVYNCLRQVRCDSVDDLMKMTDEELKAIRGIGAAGLRVLHKVQNDKKESSMTVFLSHKMNGLTEEEIFKIRKKAVKYLSSRYGNIEVIDNVHHDDAPENAGRIWHLGRSIQMMSEADAVYFCKGWMNAKGCQIEYEVCKEYNLKILE